ncbi:DUF2185 domain-containing protein [Gordonia crocea]|uniref:Immunity protein Imm33 domain-containing protein n=1 Tax=Gordonia crocea TaxID=589162 RepID=A0A7M3SUJ6_9ACTN|nr:DUF2185 domain-containing protein [Gordonia crocea]GED96320.1 hypothetical protein nbrc107697_03590 [Gordonia crocea]
MAYTEFIPNAGACLATTNVTSRRGRVRWMVREDSQDPVDNGWRIMSHIDDEAYLSSEGCWEIVDYNDVCALEPALIEMWSLPVGSDLQLVDDEGGIRILDTATGQQVIPATGGVAATPDEDPHEIAKREDAIASETCTAMSGIPDWTLALTSITFTDGTAPAGRCLLYGAGDQEPDVEPWFATGTLPALPFIREVGLPAKLTDDLARHRGSMPDRNGRLWTTMQYAVQRDGQFYFFACRYR